MNCPICFLENKTEKYCKIFNYDICKICYKKLIKQNNFEFYICPFCRNIDETIKNTKLFLINFSFILTLITLILFAIFSINSKGNNCNIFYILLSLCPIMLISIFI